MAECIETMPVTDVYADGIAYVENLGHCIRIAFYTWSRMGGDRREKVIVAKIVRPISSLIGTEELMRLMEPPVAPCATAEREGKRSH